jgi:lysophospholipase-2
MRMPGWFDVITFDRSVTPRPEDEAGILATVDAVDALIQAEIDAGVPEEKIVLGGFSQGGAISALHMLTKKRNLGGYVSLSTWVPLAHKVEGMARDNVKDQAMFWGHGKDDEIVPFDCE